MNGQISRDPPATGKLTIGPSVLQKEQTSVQATELLQTDTQSRICPIVYIGRKAGVLVKALSWNCPV